MDKKTYMFPSISVIALPKVELLAGSELPAVVSTEEFVPDEMPTLGREFELSDDYDMVMDEEDWE